MTMNPYVCFYLEGRDSKLFKHEIDEEKLAEEVLEGADLRDVTLRAATDAAKPLEISRQKNRWQRDNEDLIKEMGGSEDKAYEAYCKGRIDEVAYHLEQEVIEALEEMVGEDGPDAEGDDTDDEEEDNAPEDP